MSNSINLEVNIIMIDRTNPISLLSMENADDLITRIFADYENRVDKGARKRFILVNPRPPRSIGLLVAW